MFYSGSICLEISWHAPGFYLSFPGYFSFQEISYLLWPVNIFQKHHRYFALLQILPFQPHIEKALRHESEKPCFVSIISCHIRPLLQFKQDIKKPGTVLIEQWLLHNEHIQNIQLSPIHHSGKSFRIARVFFCDDFLCFVQILLKVRMFVLAAYVFYVVVSLLWKNDIIFCQQIFIIGCMNRVPKVPSIVAKIDIFAVQIFQAQYKAVNSQ